MFLAKSPGNQIVWSGLNDWPVVLGIPSHNSSIGQSDVQLSKQAGIFRDGVFISNGDFFGNLVQLSVGSESVWAIVSPENGDFGLVGSSRHRGLCGTLFPPQPSNFFQLLHKALGSRYATSAVGGNVCGGGGS